MAPRKGYKTIVNNRTRSLAIRSQHTVMVIIFMVAQWMNILPAVAETEKPPPPAQHQIKVMSRNVYHGVNAEIFAIPGAPMSALPGLVTKVYEGYQKRNFPERAQAMAAEIEATQPDLIGLQEAVLVRTGTPQNPTLAVNVAYDYVQILLDALASRGLLYEVAAELHIFDITLPSSLGYFIRHTDREVILARTDLPMGHLELTNVQSGYFSVNCQIPSAFGPITIKRGWVSVDAWTRGREYRFISTHLDGDCLSVTSLIQVAQANQIVNGPANTSLPIVLVGDINSSPLNLAPSAYQAFAGSGFSDAWDMVGAGDGFTCCQSDDLLNPVSTLDTRIDVILVRGRLDASSVQMVGYDPTFRTPSGFWPSDHAGVAAVLEIIVP